MFAIVLISFINGCNSGEKKDVEKAGTNNQVGVPNVNGNIPDTTNAINLSTHKKDSAVKNTDSVK